MASTSGTTRAQKTPRLRDSAAFIADFDDGSSSSDPDDDPASSDFDSDDEPQPGTSAAHCP